MSILRNINYIKELDRIPCASPSPWIIIKTAFQSAPPALLTLALPGCTDIVKTRLGRSPWHAKSISSFIKKAVGPEVIGANKFLYQVGYTAAERYLWYWMVADVTTEFVTTWQSQIFQEQQCELPNAGTASGYYAPIVYTSPGTYRTLPGTEHGAAGVTATTFGVEIHPGYQGTFAYSMEFDSYPIPGKGANASTWLQVDEDEKIIDFAKTNDPATGSKQMTGGSIYHNRPGTVRSTRYTVYVEPQPEPPNFVRIQNAKWHVSLQGRREGNLSWGCKPKPVSWPFPSL